MKIVVSSDSCIQTVVREANDDSECEVIEISDAQWAEFSRIEEVYEGFLHQFSQALQLKQLAARSELDQARERVAILETMLKLSAPKPAARPASPAASIDETDAGHGIREVEENTSASSFKEELAMLRERTQEKRRRLQ